MTEQTPNGAALIAAERRRQVEEEGYTARFDADNGDNALAYAAACYALTEHVRGFDSYGRSLLEALWPWSPYFWKPSPDDRVRELVKAGALIAAEIDRLQQAARKDQQ